MLRQVSRLIFSARLTNMTSVCVRNFSNTSQLYVTAQKRIPRVAKTTEEASEWKISTKSGSRLKKATAKTTVKKSVNESTNISAKKPVKVPSPKRYKPLRGPKKPSNAYSLYVKESFPIEKEKSPDAKIGDITKKLAAQWHELSEEQKQIYNSKFVKAVEIYEQENKKWLESLTPLDYLRENMRRKALSLKPLKDPNRPKRPLSTYMSYAMTMIKSPEMADIRPVTKRTSLIAQKWKALGKEEKRPYEEVAQRDIKRYEAEKNAYMKRLQNFKTSEAVST